MDLNLLGVLDALLQTRSVSRAAAALGLAQPSVSRTLARLREQLGDALLVRTRFGMTLTPYAESLAVELGPALRAIEALARPRADFDPATSRRVFRIRTAEYAQIILGPALESLLADTAPGVTVVFAPWDVATALGSLEAGRDDLVLAPALTRAASVRSHALFADGFATVVRRGHAFTRSPVTWEKLAAARYIQIAPDDRDGGVVDDAFAARGVKRRLALRTPSFLTALAIAGQTELACIVPQRIADHTSAFMPIEAVATPLDLPDFTLAMFWHERVHDDAASRWLRSRLKQLAAPLGSKRRVGRHVRLRLDRRGKNTL